MFDYDQRGERATRDIVCRGDHRPHPQGPRVAERRRLYLDGPSRPRRRAARVQGHGRALRRLRLRSRRRQGRGDPDRALHDGRRACSTPIAPPRCRGSMRPARTPAACTAPTGSAATASPTRPCSAGSPATAWRRIAARECAARRSRQGRDRGGARARLRAARPRAAAISKACGERLYQVMWDDVGILRTADGLARARHELNNLAAATRPDGRRRRRAALQPDLDGPAQPGKSGAGQPRDLRRGAGAHDSRGAHYREDFPQASDLAASRYTVVRADGDGSRSRPSRSRSPAFGRPILLHQAAE